jgi:hypothetical protein
MYARVTVAPGGILTTTFTLWKNGAPTALSVVLTGVAAQGSDLVNEVVVVAGDKLEVVHDIAGAAPLASRVEMELV